MVDLSQAGPSKGSNCLEGSPLSSEDTTAVGMSVWSADCPGLHTTVKSKRLVSPVAFTHNRQLPTSTDYTVEERCVSKIIYHDLFIKWGVERQCRRYHPLGTHRRKDRVNKHVLHPSHMYICVNVGTYL